MGPVDGTISYLGESLKGSKSFHLVERKLAMVPEGRGVFTRMSIRENLMMGAYTRTDKAGVEDDIAKWFDVFPRLKERAAQMNARLALQAAHRGYVMDSGLVTMGGNAADMLDDPRVKAAYLGE
eukprot:gene15798-18774_t